MSLLCPNQVFSYSLVGNLKKKILNKIHDGHLKIIS